MTDLVCCGDSVTASRVARFGWLPRDPWPALLPGVVENRAEAGAYVRDLPTQLVDVPDAPMVVSIGKNDALEVGAPLDLDALELLAPFRPLFLPIAFTPPRGRNPYRVPVKRRQEKTTDALRDVGTVLDYRLGYLHFARDGIHQNALGNRVIVRAVRAALRDRAGCPTGSRPASGTAP